MKVKIIKPMSKFFKVGQIVEMFISNNHDSFRLYKPNSFSQSFDLSFHNCVQPVTSKELKEE